MIDIGHAEGWLSHVIEPQVRSVPESRVGIAEGLIVRADASLDYFDYCLATRQVSCGLSRFNALGRIQMAARKKSSSRRKYGDAASKRVESAMRRRKKGTLKSGKGGKGGKVKSRKQAIAIGLSEARKKGAKVPRKSSERKHREEIVRSKILEVAGL